MPAPTGNQWIRLYRGLNAVKPEEVNTQELGPHWTPDPNIAYNFATYRDTEGTPHWDAHYDEDTPEAMAGTVVEALVHRRHIVDPESEEGQGWQLEAVLGRGHPEQEHTVRPGSLVHVEKMHYFDDDNDSYRKVDVPRTLKARKRA